jgi:KUP system potassium uptake protein
MQAEKKAARCGKGIFGLSLATVGTVYGDIGTSPLYAFKESIHAAGNGGVVQPDVIIGVLSLILWALFVIVTIKYVLLLLRADNNGEGGILSLMALAQNGIKNKRGKLASIVVFMGIAGASLFYGDAIITPAISVLSAVEGLNLITKSLKHFIIPISIVVLFVLFIVQRKGTSKISNLFAPIMCLWFIALAVGGILHVKENLGVLHAFNPVYAFEFVLNNGTAGLIALGAVFLSVTGAEALYADLGHFGKRPIRLTWIFFVMPSLVLNYLGQAALILNNPEAASDSFYLLYPEWATIPMIILATLATLIASQAVITGAYSITHQAVQLSLLPRMRVQYTSRDQMGQIYMPQVNWLLFFGIVFIISLFRTSSSLASAYGIAVTGTMVITALLTFAVMRYVWNWKLYYSLLVMLPLLTIDLTFLGANMLKFMAGGYVPVFISAILILMMTIWVTCSKLLHHDSRDQNSIGALTKILLETPPQRVSGVAVYFSSSSKNAPAALLHNLKHNKVLHAHNYILTLKFENKPYIKDSERIRTRKVGTDFTRVFVSFGYMEPTNITRVLKLMKKRGFDIDIDNTSFFISRRHLVPSPKVGVPLWQDYIFIAMASNATDAAEYFNIPQDRVVELGSQVHI